MSWPRASGTLTHNPNPNTSPNPNPHPLTLTLTPTPTPTPTAAQDDTYDDILPAMGVVSQLKVESLRIEESQMLASMLCHATMFVTPTEFHNLLTAVQQRSWARMDRPAVLLLVKDVLSGEASATQTQPNAATPSTLRKGSSFREQARARPILHAHAPGQARALSPPPAISRRLAPALTVRPTPVPGAQHRKGPQRPAECAERREERQGRRTPAGGAPVGACVAQPARVAHPRTHGPANAGRDRTIAGAGQATAAAAILVGGQPQLAKL